jgi:PKD repeat protein
MVVKILKQKTMRTFINKIILFVLPAMLVVSCAKPLDYPNETEQAAFFSYTADSYVVTFTNESKNTGTYHWDFGDGATSNDENPVHNYVHKGKFLVTLTVTGEGTTANASTVMLLDKTSNVKLNDGTLDDWDNITKNVVISGPEGQGVKLGKFDYDANYIYIYLEQESTIADGTIFSIFMDTDTTLSTGFQLGAFPGVGAELYMEGQIPTPEPWLDPYTYSGDGTNWAWDYFQANDYYKPGFYEESGGLLRYELGISRTKLPGLTNEAVRIAIIVMDSGWSDFGYMTDKGTSGFLLMMNE